MPMQDNTLLLLLYNAILKIIKQYVSVLLYNGLDILNGPDLGTHIRVSFIMLKYKKF
jgi:hypothetical protein